MKKFYLIASTIFLLLGFFSGDRLATTTGIIWLLMAKVQDVEDLLKKR